MFRATNIVKDSDKEKYVYSGYGIAFGNDLAKNVIIFGFDNSSSSHTDNLKNNFWVLGERPTFGITGRFGASEKKFDFNFSKAKQNFVWIYSLIVIIVIYL